MLFCTFPSLYELYPWATQENTKHRRWEIKTVTYTILDCILLKKCGTYFDIKALLGNTELILHQGS